MALRREFEDTGRGQRFDDLKSHLLGEGDAASYEQLAAQLGLTETGVRSVVHRLRKRFRVLMREEIAQTVGSAAEVDAELRHLLQVMGE